MTANDKAQVTVMTALAMAVLLGLVAFATDIGLFLIAKRQMQTAADSAAMAGAAEINYGDVTAAAQADSAQNGFTNGSNGVTVAVNAPTTGPHKANAGYVEVIVSQSQPTIFMKILNRGAMVVSARAVATNVPAPSCVNTLSPNPPSGYGVDLSGGADLALTGCGLTDDATPSAFKATGGITLAASFVDVVGSTSIHNGASIMGSTWPAVSTPPIVTGITPISDPLSSVLTPPPASEYSSGCISSTYGTGTYTIGPSSSSGYVCYSSFTVNSGSPTINLRPGLYIFNGSGGLNIASGTTVNGTGGVSFYFVNGASFTFKNGATMNLTAPTTSVTSVGINAGILFYEDPGQTSPYRAPDTAADTFEGGSSGTINGIFYLPAANLTFQNGGAATFSTDLVVGSLTMSGAGTLSPYAPLSGASPLSSPTLVE